MSKYETPMTEWFWDQVGGLLVEEFEAVRRNANQGQRLIDAVIVLNKNKSRHPRGKKFDIEGRNVIVVQSKHRRLSMGLMGQTLFSLDLIKKLNPSTIRSVAVCTQDDEVLRPLLEKHKGCEVWVYPVGMAKKIKHNKSTGALGNKDE